MALCRLIYIIHFTFTCITLTTTGCSIVCTVLPAHLYHPFHVLPSHLYHPFHVLPAHLYNPLYVLPAIRLICIIHFMYYQLICIIHCTCMYYRLSGSSVSSIVYTTVSSV
ncbi:hypothetical protein BDR03DRAFT_877108 [Suillus americanus]|nr:hypothetical protein BDR03DRAFT_877108 [Suillus americanus]